MKKPLIPPLAALLAGATLLFAAQPAMARDHMDWSVKVSAPVAFAPPPVVYHEPVVVYRQPRRAYQQPIHVVHYNRHYQGYREHAWREQQRRAYYARHHHHPRYERHFGEWDR